MLPDQYIVSKLFRPSQLRGTVVSLTLSSLLAQITGCGGGRVDKIVLGPEIAQSAMQQYDANGDGSLSKDELRSSPPLLASLSRIDSDGNGAVSLAELSSRIEILASGPRFIALDVRIVERGKPLVGAELTLVPETFMGEGSHKFYGTSSVGGFCSIKSDGSRLPGVPVGWYVANVVLPNSHKTVTKGTEIASDSTGNRLEISL